MQITARMMTKKMEVAETKIIFLNFGIIHREQRRRLE